MITDRVLRSSGRGNKRNTPEKGGSPRVQPREGSPFGVGTSSTAPTTPRTPIVPVNPAPAAQVAPVIPGPIFPRAMPPSYRLKHARFKGKGQDVDEWLDQFAATLAANDENDLDTTKRLFHGLLEGEALRWYNGLLPTVKNNWDQLMRAFTTEFKDVGTDSTVLRKQEKVTMDPSDTLQSYLQKVQVLISKLANPAPTNLQLEWFIAGLPALLDFEVRKAEPTSLVEAIEIAKKYEKSALLSGRWKEKKKKKKITFIASEEGNDEGDVQEDKLKQPKETKPTQIIKMVKEELETMRQAMEDVKVQMADLKKNKKPILVTRTNVWCTRCKKEGHHPDELSCSNLSLAVKDRCYSLFFGI